MAPVQKRAWINLVIVLVLASVIIPIMVASITSAKGDDTIFFDSGLGFRLFVYAVWVGVFLEYLKVVNLTLRKPGQVDERDKLIMGRAPRVQFLAVLFSLIAWVIVLTEVFGDQGQVPVNYITLIMISTIIISSLAQSLGILIGYWRMGCND